MSNDFPVEQLKPLKAVLFRAADLGKPSGMAGVEVHFAPFDVTLPESDAEEPVETFENPVRLDFIDLPSLDLTELQGRTFNFPVNPEEGYIDGSVYFRYAHNPVDVKRITFGVLQGDALPVEFDTNWLMEFESTGFTDFPLLIQTVLTRAPEMDLA